MGLEDGTNDSNDADESSEVSSIAPCVGLCHVERVQELEKDKELKNLREERNQRCVGLCYLLRCISLSIQDFNYSNFVLHVIFPGKKGKQWIPNLKNYRKADLVWVFVTFLRRK